MIEIAGTSRILLLYFTLLVDVQFQLGFKLFIVLYITHISECSQINFPLRNNEEEEATDFPSYLERFSQGCTLIDLQQRNAVCS